MCVKIPFLVCLLNLFLCGILQSQEKSFNFRSTFYDQRVTLFELLPDTTNEIILLGDSITNGANWDELFPNTNVINRGISGDTTLGVLNRLDEVLSSKPLKIFLMIGINDIGAKKDKEYILDNFNKIVSEIEKHSPTTKIYIQSVLPINDEFSVFISVKDKMDVIKEFNEDLKIFAINKKIEYIDLFSEFLDKEGKLNTKYTNDGLHLLGAGYKLWATVLRKYIY